MVKQSEMRIKDAWLDANIKGARPPFSFTYGGKISFDLLPAWKRESSESRDDTGKTSYNIIWTDSGTGLTVTCVAVTYSDYPAVEWTVYLKNTGDADTPVIEDLQGMDVALEKSTGAPFILRTIKGDACSPNSFAPICVNMEDELYLRFAPNGGRPTSSAFPYYNISWGGEGNEEGAMAVVGWPGQWAASFNNRYQWDGNKLHILAGQERTYLRLRPGEEIRTPLSLLMFWEGGVARSQNVWRRFMLDRNVPKQDGKHFGIMTSFCAGNHQSEEKDLKVMKEYTDHGLIQDYWWMDSGWYPGNTDPEWWNVGTWEADKERFPNGLKAISDAAHASGRKMIVWFEPERVSTGSWIYENHPEWLFMYQSNYLHMQSVPESHSSHLFNLGDPEALDWLINHIDNFIKENEIDLYRTDYNIFPLPFWRNADTFERQGMTENLCVQGFLKLWDELQKRNPKLWFDTCASGGRRLDLETLRRSFPLCRSDFMGSIYYKKNKIHSGNQGHTYGLAQWVPYYGTGCFFEDRYLFFSHLCPSVGMGYNYVEKSAKPVDWEKLLETERIWRGVAENFYGDFYPLTGYSLSEEAWMAWQFDRPEAGEGFVQAFRREDAEEPSMTYKLNGLDVRASYDVINVETDETARYTGAELANGGLAVTLNERRKAVILLYKKV